MSDPNLMVKGLGSLIEFTKVIKSLKNSNDKHSSKKIVFLKIIAKEIAFLKL